VGYSKGGGLVALMQPMLLLLLASASHADV
jgi:hypothetical protein